MNKVLSDERSGAKLRVTENRCVIFNRWRWRINVMGHRCHGPDTVNYLSKSRKGKPQSLCIIICGRVPTSEKMAGYMTTLRIYNDPNNKRTFIRQMVPDFQEYKYISDFKASVFELTKENFSDKKISLQDVNIGFIGASNQKSFVTTSPQLYDAYNSRFLHKHELKLFRKRHKEKGQSRRSSSTLNGK